MCCAKPVLLLAVASLIAASATAGTTVEYAFASRNVASGRAPVIGASHTTSTIDGPVFRNVSRRANAVELSDDDGFTTCFERLHTTPQTPLVTRVGAPWDPIVGSFEDESLVVGDSAPGPTMFGVPTRVYTVDYRYTIVGRIAFVVRTTSVNHARLTFTVADIGVSASALRVAFSRGYGYAVSRHGEAFTGLPLIIDGTIDSPYDTVHVHVEAESLTQ